MLYLKVNTMNCGPLGEDRRTESFKKQIAAAVTAGDEQLMKRIPMIGRRVDYVHKLYNRDWREVIGVVLWNDNHFTNDEIELKLMQAMDGKRTVADLAGQPASRSITQPRYARSAVGSARVNGLVAPVATSSAKERVTQSAAALVGI